MNVYYVNSEGYNPNGIISAVRNAYAMAKKDSNIKKITLLVGVASQYSILDPLQIDKKSIANGGFVLGNIAFQIRTLKTYHPEYLFAGREPSEILVPLYVPAKDLYRFEDYSDIARWIVLPWLKNEMVSFLSIHEAKDIETGVSMSSPGEIDGRIANGIDFLRDYAYPNQGFVNASDEDYLKSVANTLREMHIAINYDQVVYYCLNHGFLPHVARKVADYFVLAQTHNLQTRYIKTDMISILNASRG